jgi:transcriptional regulator with XRE-family HTH domain
MAGLDRVRLRTLIERSGKSARALSLEIGDNAYLLRDILSAKSGNPRMDTLQKVAEVLGVPLAALQMGGQEDDDTLTARGVTLPAKRLQVPPLFLPVRYRVQAGTWVEVDSQAQTWDEPPSHPVAPDPRYLGFQQWLERVVGDSIDKQIPEGQLAHVVDAIDLGYAPRTGDFVVVERRRNGGSLRERTIKQVVVERGVVELWPRSTNPKWREPLRLTDGAEADDGIEVEIVGLVIGSYNPFR